tara:strand:+ start:10348 stop:11391 length:1044 start_codon:yes stop_codon:yes gene_type:complete
MAFLDNSGDIILDAVLTDTGRMRLARGDGSFRIAKFAFGDDEINYELFRNGNHPSGVHPSGSAYYDIEILQTPVLEAFTNNASMLKNKLLSIPKNNLLYLPMLLFNEKRDTQTEKNALLNMFVVLVDQDTQDDFTTIGGAGNIYNTAGVINGFQTTPSEKGQNYIRLDQGLHTTEVSSRFAIPGDLVETSYLVEIDNRFGSIVSRNGNPAAPSFIDDDNIATYHFVQGQDAAFVSPIETHVPLGESGGEQQVIAGPRGTFFQFKVQASLELNSSTYLFTKLGSTVLSTALGADVELGANKTGKDLAGAVASAPSPAALHYLDTNIRVVGATTGYSMDVPVRFIKKKK